jgi:hypothetical protein
MSGKFKFDPVQQRKPAPRPSRLPQQRQQSIPRAEMPPRLRQRDIAELALQANPEKSNRAIAADARVSRMTVLRQRRSTEAYDLIEKTIGIDGKSRPARRRSERDAQPIPRNAPAINVELNWRAEIEEVVGPPGNRLQDVLARCSSPAAHGARRPNDRRRAEGRQKGGDNV